VYFLLFVGWVWVWRTNAVHPSGNGLCLLLGIYRSTEVTDYRISDWLAAQRNTDCLENRMFWSRRLHGCMYSTYR